MSSTVTIPAAARTGLREPLLGSTVRSSLRGSGVQTVITMGVTVGQLDEEREYRRIVATSLGVLKCLQGKTTSSREYAGLDTDAMWNLASGTCVELTAKLAEGAVALGDMKERSAGIIFLLAYSSECKEVLQELSELLYPTHVLAAYRDAHLVSLFNILKACACEVMSVHEAMEQRMLDPAKEYGCIEPDDATSQASESARVNSWKLGLNMPAYKALEYVLTDPRASVKSLNLFELVHGNKTKPDHVLPVNSAFKALGEHPPFTWPTYMKNGELRKLTTVQELKLWANTHACAIVASLVCSALAFGVGYRMSTVACTAPTVDLPHLTKQFMVSPPQLGTAAIATQQEGQPDDLGAALRVMRCNLQKAVDGALDFLHVPGARTVPDCDVHDPYAPLCAGVNAAVHHVGDAVASLNDWKGCAAQCKAVQYNVTAGLRALAHSAPEVCAPGLGGLVSADRHTGGVDPVLLNTLFAKTGGLRHDEPWGAETFDALAGQLNLGSGDAERPPGPQEGGRHSDTFVNGNCWAIAIMSSGSYVVLFPSLLFVFAACAGVAGIIVIWVTNTVVHALAALSTLYAAATLLGGWSKVDCSGEVGIAMVVATFACAVLLGHVLSQITPSATAPMD